MSSLATGGAWEGLEVNSRGTMKPLKVHVNLGCLKGSIAIIRFSAGVHDDKSLID